MYISIEIIKQLIRSPDQLPHKSDLTNFLTKNPPVKICLLPIIITNLVQQLIYPPSYGKTEDSYYDLWDSIIKNTIEIFGIHSASLPTLEFDRNTSKSQLPRHGYISEKYLSSSRDVLYIFAYYAIGVQVTFVTLYKSENKKRKLNCIHESKPKLIMHRDVQWPNIIHYYEEYQRFILIDFDYADFSPSDEPLEEFSESDYAPEMLNKKHVFKDDIWGVRNLISSCNVTGIPSKLSSFSTDLCKSNPNK
ncbi:1212_t:CDS:2 [Dentiscutata heterogama]|uniref:1212_t:CDS:1 n=1 Tax=Dentiscutata heterogama TaxID=1316150 RepID=A0ACA9K9I6_9GLOM|nr:1212_t:CDS:2 [Dentiscutata heterogama]